MSGVASAEDVVDRMYGAFFAGDVDGALACCTADAQWHAVTPGTPWSGSHGIRQYFTEILPGAMRDLDGYAVERVERDVIGELVVSRLWSSYGSGVMVFRVVDDKVSDIWVINSKGRDADRPF